MNVSGCIPWDSLDPSDPLRNTTLVCKWGTCGDDGCTCLHWFIPYVDNCSTNYLVIFNDNPWTYILWIWVILDILFVFWTLGDMIIDFKKGKVLDRKLRLAAKSSLLLRHIARIAYGIMLTIDFANPGIPSIALLVTQLEFDLGSTFLLMCLAFWLLEWIDLKMRYQNLQTSGSWEWSGWLQRGVLSFSVFILCVLIILDFVSILKPIGPIRYSINIVYFILWCLTGLFLCLWTLIQSYSIHQMLSKNSTKETSLLIRKNQYTFFVGICLLGILVHFILFSIPNLKNYVWAFYGIAFSSQGPEIIYCFLLMLALKQNTDGKSYPPYLYLYYEIFGQSDGSEYHKFSNDD